MIEQAIYGSRGAGGYRFLARSPGFPQRPGVTQTWIETGHKGSFPQLGGP